MPAAVVRRAEAMRALRLRLAAASPEAPFALAARWFVPARPGPGARRR
jgi:hypothetical protein